MSEHKISLNWKRETPDFTYETYERSHRVKFEGGHEMEASAAPEYFGAAENANPEEMLAAAAASCHMLTFLAIAAKSRLTVDAYEDHAVAVLDKRADGRMAVTKIVLHPKISFSGSEIPDGHKLKELHEKSHRHCFIANSLNFPVTVEDVD